MTEQAPEATDELVEYLAVRCITLTRAVAEDDRPTQSAVFKDLSDRVGAAGLMIAFRTVADCWEQWSGVREALRQARQRGSAAHVRLESLQPELEGPMPEGPAAALDAAHRFLVAHTNGADGEAREIFDEWGGRDEAALLGGALVHLAHSAYDGTEWRPPQV